MSQSPYERNSFLPEAALAAQLRAAGKKLQGIKTYIVEKDKALEVTPEDVSRNSFRDLLLFKILAKPMLNLNEILTLSNAQVLFYFLPDNVEVIQISEGKSVRRRGSKQTTETTDSEVGGETWNIEKVEEYIAALADQQGYEWNTIFNKK